MKKRSSEPVKEYGSFNELFDEEIASISSQLRLDGQNSGSNRRPFAKFRHNGRRWKLNSDSRVAPLVRARKDPNPFVEGKTKDGTNALRVKRELRDSKFIEVYIYEC